MHETSVKTKEENKDWATGHSNGQKNTGNNQGLEIARDFSKTLDMSLLRAMGNARVAQAMQTKGPGKQLPGKQLPENLKEGIENLSGYSMDDVNVHYNSPKPSQLHAQAYTQGSNIHIAPGMDRHLPHEAWHAVQQKQGRVRPTPRMEGRGLNINDDRNLEREADIFGTKASQTRDFPLTPPSPPAHGQTRWNTIHGTKASQTGESSLNPPSPMKYGQTRSNTIQATGGYQALQDNRWAHSTGIFEKFRKKELLVKEIIKQKVALGTPGWFELNKRQLEIYSSRVFELLDEIQNSDMNVLMIAHQQVNMGATLSPEEKADDLEQQIRKINEKISKLEKDFDVQTKKEKKEKLKRERRNLNKKDPFGYAAKIQQLTDEINTLNDEIIPLNLGRDRQNVEERLKNLMGHKKRLERELMLQEAQVGKEGINIDFLNTTEKDEHGREIVRIYMAIVAPDFNNNYKDFYLKDNDKLTYSANDKVMWVSFGTPFRTISWFQKYSLDAPGDNVPLIRSFAVPISYINTFMQNLTTEEAALRKGSTLETEKLNLKLEDYYGKDYKGQFYRGEINLIDPFLMNVDIKYPNQFGIGRVITTEERPRDRDFFDKTTAKASQLREELDSAQYDQQIKSTRKNITELEDLQEQINNEDYSYTPDEFDRIILEKFASIDLTKLSPSGMVKTFFRPLIEGESLEDFWELLQWEPHDSRSRALRILNFAEDEPRLDEANKKLAELKKAKREAVEGITNLTTGDSKLKGHLADIAKKLEKEFQSSGIDMGSSAMKELLKKAISGSFKTIAMGKDRSYEHISYKEGPLQEYWDLIASLGPQYNAEHPAAHLLGKEYTALHKLDMDSWSSQTPEQTREIYSKMRFFFHGLDSRISNSVPLDGENDTDLLTDLPTDLDISLDSHLEAMVRQIEAKQFPDKKMINWYQETNVVDTLGTILDLNQATPADVLGLPEDLYSDRRDRHGNLMVRSAAETFFAEQTIASEKSLDFIADNVDKLIKEIEKPEKAPGLRGKLGENTYLKRDIQELLGKKVEKSPGIEAEIPLTRHTIVKVLEKMRHIRGEKNRHAQLRMVYFFFHFIRPFAQIISEKYKSKVMDPIPQAEGELAGSGLEIKNRDEQSSHFDFLNPQPKTFGILDPNLVVRDKSRDMPYDKMRSPNVYVPQEESDMTKYMKRQDQPFVGGVSGTTRDQSQVLEEIFDKETLKKNYWDFQLLNAAFMIGNAYHSFFESIYVAARYDRYTDIGAKVLTEFDKASLPGTSKYEIYVNILKLIDADRSIFDGFEDWYNEKVKE